MQTQDEMPQLYTVLDARTDRILGRHMLCVEAMETMMLYRGDTEVVTDHVFNECMKRDDE